MFQSAIHQYLDTRKHSSLLLKAVLFDMDGVLFLIGIQELGSGKQEFTKEQKQDLMHIAVCTLLAQSGYYVMEGYDEENWPHFKQLKPLPTFETIEQENFLKDHALLYFQQLGFI